jgi:type I restriction enzyme S subunit
VTSIDETLPDGWESLPLSSIGGRPQYGWTTKAQRDGPVKLLRTTDITSGAVDWSTVPSCVKEPPDTGKYELEPGDIVVSRAGSVGVSYLLDESCPPGTVFASYLMRVRPDPQIMRPDLMYHFMQSPQYWAQISEAAVGIGMANVSGSKLGAIRIPVPPFDIQQELSSLLDSMRQHARSAKRHVAAAKRALTRYRRAVFAAACSGRLTVEWRNSRPHESGKELVLGLAESASSAPRAQSAWRASGDSDAPEIPEAWGVAGFGDLTINYDGRRVPVKASDRSQRRGPYPYYGASGIIDSVDDYLFDGDFLLVSEDGANLLARATPIAFRAQGRFWVNNHAHVVQSKTGMLDAYLESAVEALDLQNHVTGSAQPKLTKGALNSLMIPVPSTAEQEEISRRVQRLLALGREVERRLQVVDKGLDRGTAAILERAFLGRLKAIEVASG